MKGKWRYVQKVASKNNMEGRQVGLVESLFKTQLRISERGETSWWKRIMFFCYKGAR